MKRQRERRIFQIHPNGLTWRTVAFGDVAFGPEDRARIEPLHLPQLLLYLRFEPLHQRLDVQRRRGGILNAQAACLQTGDPGLEAELAVEKHTGHGEAGQAKGAHRPVEAGGTRAEGLVAKLPRHRRLQAGRRRGFARARARRPGLGRRLGLHRCRCRVAHSHALATNFRAPVTSA